MLTLKLIWRYLFSGKTSTKIITAVALLGTFIATASLILTLGVMNGFQKAVSDSLLRHTPHLLVFTGDKTRSEEVIQFAKQTFGDEIKRAFWYATFQVIIQHGKYVTGTVVYASKGKTLEELLDFRRNTVLGKFQKNGLAVGTILADSLGIDSVPTPVVLINPVAESTPVGFLPQMEEFNVTAVYATGFYFYDNAAVADYEYLSRYFKPTTFNVVIQLKDPYRAQYFASLLREHFPDLYISTWIDRNKDFFNALRLEKIATVLVVGLIAVVAVFNIFSLMLVKIGELRRDFAVFRAFGVGRGFIFRLVLLQGGLIGVIGSTLGVIFALAVTYVVNKYRLIQVPSDVYLTPYIPVVNGLLDYAGVVVLVVGMSLLSSALPAYFAIRESVSKILRND